MAERRIGAHQGWTIGLLSFGGFLGILGWVIGVYLLWTSSSWTRREKVIGTFVLPGGLALLVFPPIVFSSTETCYKESGQAAVCSTSGGSDVLIVITLAIIVIAQVWSMTYLWLKARETRRYDQDPK
jgi:hypothetical protein